MKRRALRSNRHELGPQAAAVRFALHHGRKDICAVLCSRRANLNELRSIVFLIAVLSMFAPVAAQEAQTKSASNRDTLRSRYQIELNINFESLSYTGTERVRWVNKGNRSTAVLYFHLYPNHRPVQLPTPAAVETEEPRLDIIEVRAGIDQSPLSFSLEDQGTTLRVGLREGVPPGQAVEVVLGFKGTVPEIDPDETNLTTHVVKQVSAALRGDREARRPREINFRSRGIMLLGAAYPVLAVQRADEWLRKIEPGVGDMIFNDVAEYEVGIETDDGVALFTSAGDSPQINTHINGTFFRAPALRDFAIIAGRNLRSEQVQVGETTLRSIYVSEHERVGKRVLTMAEESLKIFTAKFGPLPFRTISVTEAPLVAGLGSTEFSGLEVIASAYYVDFDSPAVRNLPEIIREQRPSVEESLEWSVAHLMAHQWWGAAVGNNPEREPVLDEAMASWSALLYFRERYGEQKAKAILEDQLRGVYRLYRTFGGEDMNADRPSRDYRNTFQYAALVMTKGALMFVELERQLGADTVLAAFRKYYQKNLLDIAELDDLRGALIAEVSIEQRKGIDRTFNRWLGSKRGDVDIAKPDQDLATSLGLPDTTRPKGNGDRRALGAFARLGKFFWQQMTRIR